MIGRIAIENYKSLESLTLDLGRVTVLIGANGSGKSNILESIALCSAAAANKLDNEFLFARGVRVPNDMRHMFPAFDDSDNSKSNVTVSDDKGETLFKMLVENTDGHLSQSFKFTNTDKEHHLSTDRTLKRRNIKLKKSTLRYAEKAALQAGYRNAGIPNISLFINSLIEKDVQQNFEQFQSDIKSSYEGAGIVGFLPFAPENTFLRRFEEEGQIQPLGIRGEGLFKLLTVLARDENRDRLDELQERLQLLDWFGEFQIGGNVALGERTLRIRDQYLDGDLAYFTQRSANEGFLFLLFYFALFVAKETPRFFAIDNIDASLNPKLCAELLRQLTELAEKYDKQVILTTHNPAVLDGLNLHDDNQRLYVVERDLDGRTQARRVPAPRPPEKHEEPVPLSEAFLRGYIGGLPKNF